jgi:hypothetical protein
MGNIKKFSGLAEISRFYYRSKLYQSIGFHMEPMMSFYSLLVKINLADIKLLPRVSIRCPLGKVGGSYGGRKGV